MEINATVGLFFILPDTYMSTFTYMLLNMTVLIMVLPSLIKSFLKISLSFDGRN